VTEAELRDWLIRPAGESENTYGSLDWTGAKDGHLELEAAGRTLRLRVNEEGVHPRGRWEEQVARFADVPADSLQRTEAPLPEGDYDARGTGRLKLELQWGPWWTRQQTRWADSGTTPLEARIPEVLTEIERRAAAGIRPTTVSLDALDALWPPARRQAVQPDPVRGQLLDEHFGAVLGDEARRWEQAERVRRYLDAMERLYGEHAETAEWLAWGRAYADRLDPLRDLPSPPRHPREPGLAGDAAEPD
jgi:hypothetical protein